jgi:hypothetical protein
MKITQVEEVTVQIPRLRSKLLFWLLLTAISGLLVEVGTTSSPLLFFTFWGLLVTCPLYGLHVLVLAYIAFLSPRIRLPLLFVCGAILGLYEAYITKVLWAPTWGPPNGATFAGVHLFQTAILLLMAHPFLAFVIPLAVAELFFTSSAEIAGGMPGPIGAVLTTPRGRLYASSGLACFLGAYHALTPGGPVIGGLGAFANTLVVALIAIAWRRQRRNSAPTLRQLLPDRRQFAVLALLLCLFYAVALRLRPEALPHTLPPHAAILCLYVALITLLWLNIRAGKTLGPPDRHPASAYADTRPLVMFLIVFPTAAALFSLLPPVAVIVVAASWIIGCGAGAVLLCIAVCDAFAMRGAPQETAN